VDKENFMKKVAKRFGSKVEDGDLLVGPSSKMDRLADDGQED